MSCFFSSQVIAVVFQYLDMLRREGPKKRIFDEAKTIADNSFRWQEQVNIIYPKKYAHGFWRCCALLWLYIDWFSHIHQAYFTSTVSAKQSWWIWINTSCEFIMNDCITKTKQSRTKPCAYFLGYTVCQSVLLSAKPHNIIFKRSNTKPRYLYKNSRSFSRGYLSWLRVVIYLAFHSSIILE